MITCVLLLVDTGATIATFETTELPHVGDGVTVEGETWIIDQERTWQLSSSPTGIHHVACVFVTCRPEHEEEEPHP